MWLHTDIFKLTCVSVYVQSIKLNRNYAATKIRPKVRRYQVIFFRVKNCCHILCPVIVLFILKHLHFHLGEIVQEVYALLRSADTYIGVPKFEFIVFKGCLPTKR